MASDLTNDYHIPSDNWKETKQYQLPIEQVDEIADGLVQEYDNPNWRKWYCGVIYKFGPAQITEWRSRAAGGKEPAKLFSLYVKQAQRLSSANREHS